MPEGRRYSPENPSPTMLDYAAHIRQQGYDDNSTLETIVAATFVFHRDWQADHAERVRQERAAGAGEREAAKAAKAAEREQKKLEREKAKAERELEREQKRLEREAAKAEKEAAKQLDGDDSDSATADPARTTRRLRTKEPETVGASEASF